MLAVNFAHATSGMKFNYQIGDDTISWSSYVIVLCHNIIDFLWTNRFHIYGQSPYIYMGASTSYMAKNSRLGVICYQGIYTMGHE